MTETHWHGFTLSKTSQQAGRAVCDACKLRLGIRACWVKEPSQQCLVELQLHASSCPGRAAGRRVELTPSPVSQKE